MYVVQRETYTLSDKGLFVKAFAPCDEANEMKYP